MRRRLALALLALATFAPGAAAADPSFEVSADPPRVSFPVSELGYRIKVTTGAEAERFDLLVREVRHFDPRGSLMHFDCGAVRMEGPGTAGPVPCPAIAAPAPCSRFGFAEWHGRGYNFSERVPIEIPANTTTTIVVRGQADEDAPWRGVAYSADLAVEGGTLERPWSLQAPGIPNDGRHGVKITLATDVPGADVCGTPPATTARPVTISGTTDLAGDPGQLIRLQIGEPSGRTRILAELRTAQDGSFRHTWTPAGPGRYELIARYDAQRVETADDYSNTLALELVEGPGDGEPRARARLASVSRFDRAGRAVARIRCPGTGAPCTGTLRLASATRATRFSVPAGRTASIRVRLTRSARARMARVRRLATTATIRDAQGVTLKALVLRRR